MRGHVATDWRAKRCAGRPVDTGAVISSARTPVGPMAGVAWVPQAGATPAALIHSISSQNRHRLSIDLETDRTEASLAINIAHAAWPDICPPRCDGNLPPRMGNRIHLGISALERLAAARAASLPTQSPSEMRKICAHPANIQVLIASKQDPGILHCAFTPSAWVRAQDSARLTPDDDLDLSFAQMGLSQQSDLPRTSVYICRSRYRGPRARCRRSGRDLRSVQHPDPPTGAIRASARRLARHKSQRAHEAINVCLVAHGARISSCLSLPPRNYPAGPSVTLTSGGDRSALHIRRPASC